MTQDDALTELHRAISAAQPGCYAQVSPAALAWAINELEGPAERLEEGVVVVGSTQQLPESVAGRD